ncbi:type VII secretion protein EssC [Enorma phocaeensis]|uniref:type VII secretion protein EssC n=1 Tax=Enorma phocaeensis TaxID=1871019 RepID=UPI000C853862|nr:type VII secretion protein EssC [Enorma phocaeensis]
MIVTVQSRERLRTRALPETVAGAHWIEDAAGTRLAFIEGREGFWHIEPAGGMNVRGMDGAGGALALTPRESMVLNLDSASGETWCLVFYPDSPGTKETQIFGFTGDGVITVGRAPENDVCYDNPFVSALHLTLAYQRGVWTVQDERSQNGVFVNGARIRAGVPYRLAYGDVVAFLDERITVGKGLFSCNCPGGAVRVRESFVRYRAVPVEAPTSEQDAKPAYFYPALRFARSIEPKDFVIDAPPQPPAEEKMSLAMRIGPSLVMVLASVLSAMVSVSTLADQGGSMIRAVPMIGMAVAMLAGSVLWPILSSRSQTRQRREDEARRRAAYSQYLSSKLTSIAEEENLQRQILCENRIPVQACLERAYTGSPELMDRTALHDDYLAVRLGLGSEPLQANIRFPESHFSVVEDDVRDAVDAQAREPRVLREVPVAYSLIDKPVLGVVGDRELARSFVRGIMVQIAALCSYDDVKLMVLCDGAERDEWSFAWHLPHCFSGERSVRFTACGMEEASELGMYMERVLDARRAADVFEARDAQPYYVVVCASEDIADTSGLVRSIVESRENLGVSLIAIARDMHDLPKECRSVIHLGHEGSYQLDRDDPLGNRREFVPDIGVTRDLAQGFAFAMGRVKLDVEVAAQHIPDHLGFLELEGAGSVEHLSIAARWRESNASATLACPVGVDAQGEPLMLNLHEKFHGPHGLIAGTTGSGKSEFIITWILSMAITYSPNDVAFVLIDYKGGGLAKAFDNEHVHLPHLAGVITNLDGAAIKRSLVSIQSELKRRQALFNRARDAVGGDNVDIYTYLDLFRQGKMTEPCPHLFIVADEFAELKQQEPDFMDELISAARIGRSLGVHLVLATQKPSGVVNDQIWSNARFKVCLKVADEADSREMIRRPDAASFSQAGRFFLLVGYNEYSALGQAAYAGACYTPRERFIATRDEAVTLISDTGRQLVSVKPDHAVDTEETGPESVAVLRMVERVAAEEGLRARQLWLEPIPARIVVDEVAAKYRVPCGGIADAQAFSIAPVVGEFDDPQRQRQGPLVLDLTRNGSALVYGSAETGAEQVLRSALYGMLQDFDATELNAYVLDFGSESMRAFAQAPQVGGVVCAEDEEQARRFFDLIEGVQVRRRAQLAQYGGSFDRYIAAGGAMPAIVVVLNGLPAFTEAAPQLEERLVRFLREAGRSGIYVIASAPGSSSLRIRMRQTFRQILVCDPSDPTEYGTVFGSMRGIPLPRGYGRGLTLTDEGIFEFQAAQLSRTGDDYGAAAALGERLLRAHEAAGLPQAQPVPTVPEHIDLDALLVQPVHALYMPYGLYEDTLESAGFDFDEAAMVRVLYQRRKSGAAFLHALVAVAANLPAWDVALVDAAQLFGATKPEGCSFATRKHDQGLAYLASALSGSLPTKQAEEGAHTTLVIVTGIAGLLSSGDRETATLAKQHLQSLALTDAVRVMLFDAAADVSYGYDDWFKAQMTNRDGLWIGPGIEAQTAFNVSYTKFVPDHAMRAERGYAIEGGTPRLVRLVRSAAGDEGSE